jgi:heme/copper-type cytochrome/quinol oxidase subunit 3
MSVAAERVPGIAASASAARPTERRRGEIGMWSFIATEAMLFGLLFFAYFYLASGQSQWPPREDPPYALALVLLVLLLVSSGTAQWAKSGIERGNRTRLVAGLALTLLLSAAFIVVQAFEYRSHWRTLRPSDSAYGSIFYTITSFHFAHVLIGVLLLLFTLARALAGHFDAQRHLAVRNTVAYWHFVDLVWIFVVAILYLSPHWTAPP